MHTPAPSSSSSDAAPPPSRAAGAKRPPARGKRDGGEEEKKKKKKRREQKKDDTSPANDADEFPNQGNDEEDEDPLLLDEAERRGMQERQQKRDRIINGLSSADRVFAECTMERVDIKPPHAAFIHSVLVRGASGRAKPAPEELGLVQEEKTTTTARPNPAEEEDLATDDSGDAQNSPRLTLSTDAHNEAMTIKMYFSDDDTDDEEAEDLEFHLSQKETVRQMYKSVKVEQKRGSGWKPGDVNVLVLAEDLIRDKSAGLALAAGGQPDQLLDLYRLDSAYAVLMREQAYVRAAEYAQPGFAPDPASSSSTTTTPRREGGGGLQRRAFRRIIDRVSLDPTQIRDIAWDTYAYMRKDSGVGRIPPRPHDIGTILEAVVHADNNPVPDTVGAYNEPIDDNPFWKENNKDAASFRKQVADLVYNSARTWLQNMSIGMYCADIQQGVLLELLDKQMGKGLPWTLQIDRFGSGANASSSVKAEYKLPSADDLREGDAAADDTPERGGPVQPLEITTESLYALSMKRMRSFYDEWTKLGDAAERIHPRLRWLHDAMTASVNVAESVFDYDDEIDSYSWRLDRQMCKVYVVARLQRIARMALRFHRNGTADKTVHGYTFQDLLEERKRKKKKDEEAPPIATILEDVLDDSFFEEMGGTPIVVGIMHKIMDDLDDRKENDYILDKFKSLPEEATDEEKSAVREKAELEWTTMHEGRIARRNARIEHKPRKTVANRAASRKVKPIGPYPVHPPPPPPPPIHNAANWSATLAALQFIINMASELGRPAVTPIVAVANPTAAEKTTADRPAAPAPVQATVIDVVPTPARILPVTPAAPAPSAESTKKKRDAVPVLVEPPPPPTPAAPAPSASDPTTKKRRNVVPILVEPPPPPPPPPTMENDTSVAPAPPPSAKDKDAPATPAPSAADPTTKKMRNVVPILVASPLPPPPTMENDTSAAPAPSAADPTTKKRRNVVPILVESPLAAAAPPPAAAVVADDVKAWYAAYSKSEEDPGASWKVIDSMLPRLGPAPAITDSDVVEWSRRLAADKPKMAHQADAVIRLHRASLYCMQFMRDAEVGAALGATALFRFVLNGVIDPERETFDTLLPDEKDDRADLCFYACRQLFNELDLPRPEAADGGGRTEPAPSTRRSAAIAQLGDARRSAKQNRTMQMVANLADRLRSAVAFVNQMIGWPTSFPIWSNNDDGGEKKTQ